MSESILLVCQECGNDDEFSVWNSPGSDTIAALCESCEALEVWEEQ